MVSAEGIPGNGTDPWHFSAAGYRTFGRRYAAVVLDVMNHPELYTKTYTIDERLTGGVSALSGKTFAIVNEADNKAFYGSFGSDVAYDSFKNAFDISNEWYLFKISRITGGRSLKLVTPDGEEYQMDGGTAYLNSQATNGSCCFVNGLNNQRGFDIQDGAVWDIQYEEGKGWTLLNKGTGKYLKDAAHPAMYDEPTYFTFCTLKEADPTGIEEVRDSKPKVQNGAFYTLSGRKLNGRPSQSGIYIKDGRLVVIK